MPIFLTRYWRSLMVAATVASIALWFAFCRPQPNVIPPTEQKSIDSLEITKPAFDSTQHAVSEAAVKVVTKIVHDSSAAAAARADADEYRRVADLAMAMARAQHDTSSAAFEAAQAATKEAAQLRAIDDSLTHDLSLAKSTIVDLRGQMTRDSTRLYALGDLNQRLAHDVLTAGQCHILPFVRCPTRKEVVVLTVAADAGVRFVSSHRKQLGLP